jgi:hypothetical protein
MINNEEGLKEIHSENKEIERTLCVNNLQTNIPTFLSKTYN